MQEYELRLERDLGPMNESGIGRMIINSAIRYPVVFSIDQCKLYNAAIAAGYKLYHQVGNHIWLTIPDRDSRIIFENKANDLCAACDRQAACCRHRIARIGSSSIK